MLFERIYEEGLAQASYFIGCQRKGQAIVVDARRDIQVYLDLAAKNGMDIIAVTETHIHADYLSGTRELASSTGATVYLSGRAELTGSTTLTVRESTTATPSNWATLPLQLSTPRVTPLNTCPFS